ncbi:SDR family oxidoreductase [Yeosuana sp. MJ-SS3]|uniref:SDR family oxidoreductase n=1 Tax=Gilvirhabdus luticola TaxID=3079858 RepID=A0ABU3U2M4_9FLAO|nr:SDR family oxidoreductase [Yeosuana sp. MJ-SS3]MDU8884645.1 SDR family oxidoreductase [Yeosuana sp. MJ-SS3]
MNVLVTGGFGYVGSSLIPILFKNEEIKKIVIYDNLSNNNYDLVLSHLRLLSKVTFVEGSILDNELLKVVFKKHEIHTIVHLAAKTVTPMSDNGFHEFDQINHWGTSILVDAINSVKSVKNIIYLSSFSVYGIYKSKFNENDNPMPYSNYGKSKFLGEKEILLRLPKSINKFILRSGVLYGCTIGYKPNTVLNKFIFEAHFSNKIQIFGDGNQKRSFIHVQRLSETISGVITNTAIKSGVYNILDHSYSVNDLAKILTQIYPNIDLIYMNRDHSMKSIEIESNYNLNSLLNLKQAKNIDYYLKRELSKFSF